MESIRGGAGFGAGLDLDWRGTTLAVGARGYQPASERGAILLYSRNQGTWSAPEIIEPSLTNREAFGESFALSSSGKVLATIAAEHGVYPKIFLVSFTRNRTGWSQRSILDSPSPDTFVDGFGRSMAISFTGGTLAVGGARYYPDPNDLNVWRDVVYVY